MKTFFNEEKGCGPFTDDMDLNSIDQVEADGLDGKFEEVEVFEALNSLCGDKAPGLDGLSIAFVQKCWVVIKDDLLKIFGEFFVQAKLEKSLNATFIALIPKKWEVVDVRDFRPISLLGSVYKIISKVLALRLVKVVGNLISPAQFAFIGGRQIVEKAYDHVKVLILELKVRFRGLLLKLIWRRLMTM